MNSEVVKITIWLAGIAKAVDIVVSLQDVHPVCHTVQYRPDQSFAGQHLRPLLEG